MACPCGSDLDYRACCGPLHAGAAKAATAERLMRSRYTAYALGELDYLQATHDPATRDSFDRAAAGKWIEWAEFLRLDILATSKGGAGDEAGTVEFIAWFEEDGRLQALHERSRFRRLDGAWVYTDGEQRSADGGLSKRGRNDPCPCGSGRKFKKCHGG